MNTLNSSPLSDCGGLAILPAPLLLHQGEDLPALPLAIAAEAPRPTVSRIPGHLQTWWTGHPTSDILWGPVGFQSPPLLCASRPLSGHGSSASDTESKGIPRAFLSITLFN